MINCTFCNKKLTKMTSILCDGVIGFLNHASEENVIGCDVLMCRECATKIGFMHYSKADDTVRICDTIDLCPVCKEKQENKSDGLTIVNDVEQAKRQHQALINRKTFRVV